MSKFPSDAVRIYPLLSAVCTAGVSTGEVGNLCQSVKINGQQNFSVVISCKLGAASGADGVGATAAGSLDFSICEATAATAAGTAISGATLSLGATATSVINNGALVGMFRVASNLATTVNYVLNGSSYHVSTSGATADAGAVGLARMINGQATGATQVGKLAHYAAFANAGASNELWVIPDDDQATGISISATGAATGIRNVILQGVIDVGAWKLSTNTPKYIRVAATANGNATVGQISGILVSYPTGPGTPGKRVVCAT